MLLSNEKHMAADGQATEAIRSGSLIPHEILKHSQDADEAMKAFAEQQGMGLEIDAATNKRLLRKIDLHLMPVRLSL